MSPCSKQQIENKRLAALEKIRAKNNSHLNNTSFGHNSQNPNNSFGCSNSPRLQSIGSNHNDHTKSNGVGPLLQSNSKNAKFQPYKRNSTSGISSTPPSLPNSPSIHKSISGTVYLIAKDRFEVKPSEFSEQMINIFKTIPSRSYDCTKRLWNFSLEHYEELLNKITPLKPHIVLGTIPQCVLNVMRTPQLIDTLQISLSKIEKTLTDQLMPFQVDGVRFGIDKKGRCMIADDMGLGKTFQALAIAHYYKENWPLLIVTTSTMRETWEIKIHELLPSIPMAAILCISSGREKQFLTDRQAQVIIISYKMTTLCTDLLIEKGFGAIILDESHLLKSHKARSTECMMKVTKKAKRVILLSGTPALSRPCELYTQLHIIEPKFFRGYTEFGKRYCDGKQTNFGWDMTGQSNLTELQCVLEKKFLIRRTKEQVLTCLKLKTRVSVILDSSLLAINEDTRNSLSAMANSYSKKKSVDRHAALLTFFSESAKVKIPAVCKYVSEIANNKEKFLVFAHHRNVLEAICHTLDENRIHYICIDGSTKTDYRNTLVEKFQLNDSCRCAVLSITAANAGITLTAAQLVLFAELHWNPGILNQAESRAHRIGQEGGVCVRYLLAKGTCDDFMWPMLEGKLQVLNQVGLSKDTFENTTSTQQMSSNTSEKCFSSQNNSFIPGTNIVVGNENQNELKSCNYKNGKPTTLSHDVFFDDIEGDEMLANLDF